MTIKKNILMYETIAVVLVFTIIYFVTANKISYAFTDDAAQELYQSKINLINNCATIYAKNNIELFDENNTIYMTVNELIEKGALLPDDEEGNIKDPSSDIRTMNELKVRITQKEGKISSKVLK